MGKEKKKSRFGIFLLVYIAILILGGAAALMYVRDSLVLYESAQPGVYMEGFAERLSEGGELAAEVGKMYLEAAAPGKFDDSEACRQFFASKMDGAVYSCAPAPGSYSADSPVYLVYADGDPLLRVTLRGTNPSTRLGIMSISEWETEDMEFCSTAFGGALPGVGKRYACRIEAPDIYRVYLNGVELGEEELVGKPVPLEEFQYVAEYVKVPELVTYSVEGLVAEPQIRIRDLSGAEVEFQTKDGRVIADCSFRSNTTGEEYQDQIDVLHVAKLWSSFLTRDLDGPRYGIGKLLPCLVKDSYLYQMAEKYARSVDITFVSSHSLEGFTKERVSDYIKYGEDCFSCEVYFEKNMRLTKGGGKRVDVFHNRMYFVYLEESVAKPGWYLADMQAVINGENR